MRVPLFDLTRQYAQLRTEILSTLDRVFSSGQLILSEEVVAFEREIAVLLGAKEAIGVANGSDALYIALKALNIGEGDY
ncbi:MAG TPA: DegT/DnrJ/EryC1/StrS family aminotransferase, partial [Thermotogota bacterium]|nr:DegT/DnrJ/EryC1/StrS family aminotransferase [Thermotogota bacterium]